MAIRNHKARAAVRGENVFSIRAVPPKIDHDTIQLLEDLLASAWAGKVIGLAGITICPGRQIKTVVSGEAGHNPALSRSGLKAFSRELGDWIRRG